MYTLPASAILTVRLLVLHRNIPGAEPFILWLPGLQPTVLAAGPRALIEMVLVGIMSNKQQSASQLIATFSTQVFALFPAIVEQSNQCDWSSALCVCFVRVAVALLVLDVHFADSISFC